MHKSLVVAYGLWALLGSFGAHRFYVGQRVGGATMLALACTGTLLTSIAAGWLFSAGVALVVAASVWGLVDAPRLHVWAQSCNA